MRQEIFKDIKGYEGLYQVSNLGRIKSLERDIIYPNGKIQHYNEKMLSPNSDKNEYKTIKLCKNGKIKRYLVHRLVAEAFIDNPDNLPCVNHKDENKQNNNVENLEFCSVAYNNSYGSRLETLKAKNTGQKRSEETKQKIREAKKGMKVSENTKIKLGKPVEQYDLDGNFIRSWDYIKQLDKFFGTKINSSIIRCCKGKQKTALGFIWKYKDVS